MKTKKYKGGARGGRPALDDSERRDKRIGVPVNEEEDAVISAKAAQARRTKADFLRHVGLGRRIPRPVPGINYRAYRQLGRLAADFSYAIALLDDGYGVGIDRHLAERVIDEISRIGDLLLRGE